MAEDRLFVAADAGDLDKLRYYLFTENMDVNNGNRLWYGYHALHYAAWNGDVECSRVLLFEAGANVECQNYHEITPLHYAAFRGHSECLRLLLQAKANVNSRSKKGRTPLQYAAERGQRECCKVLALEGSADVNLQDNAGMTALMTAVEYGDVACVQCLVEECGMDVRMKNHAGETALDIAIRQPYFSLKQQQVKDYLIHATQVDICGPLIKNAAFV